jgi:phosphopantothenoylcysteine decarboxylase
MATAAAAAVAAAGPSRSHRPPWTAAAHRPTQPDGIFRVLLISSGSVASIKVPLMVAALQKVGEPLTG